MGLITVASTIYLVSTVSRITIYGAPEMAQQMRTLVTLADKDTILDTSKVAKNCL